MESDDSAAWQGILPELYCADCGLHGQRGCDIHTDPPMFAWGEHQQIYRSKNNPLRSHLQAGPAPFLKFRNALVTIA